MIEANKIEESIIEKVRIEKVNLLMEVMKKK
jgi:hypothetical protein